MKKHQIFAALALLLALGFAVPSLLGLPAEANESASPTINTDHLTNLSEVAPEANAPGVETTPISDPDDSSANSPDSETTETSDELTDNNPEDLPSVDEQPSFDASNIVSLEEFNAALADSSVTRIVLGADITNSADQAFVINRDLDIDLNGHNISASAGNAVFNLEKGKITFGNSADTTGRIIASGSGVSALRLSGSTNSDDQNYTVVTIEDGVTLQANTDGAWYGLYITGGTTNAQYGIKLTLNGNIESTYGLHINGNLQDLKNAPLMIFDGATITTTEMSIYAAGYGTWNFDNTTITSEQGTAFGIKAGKFAINRSTVNANGPKNEPVSETNQMQDNGSVFQIDDNSAYVGEVEIIVNGGNYSSANNSVFYEYGSTLNARSAHTLKSLILQDGTFSAGANESIIHGITAGVVSISGGTFKGNTDSLKVYLNDHQQLVDNGDGTFSLVATNPDTDPDQPEIPGKPTTPEAPKPNAPNTGSQGLFAAGGGIANVFGAVLVGILLALGGWAWFSSRRSRRDRKSSRRNSGTTRRKPASVSRSSSAKSGVKTATQVASKRRTSSSQTQPATKSSRSRAKTPTSARAKRSASKS